MIRSFLSLAKICMNLYEFLQSAHVLPYRAESVQRVICRKRISYAAFEKGRLDPRRAQRQISDVFKNGLECGKNIAIHPLVEMTWLLQVLYPQVKMAIENQFKHEG